MFSRANLVAAQLRLGSDGDEEQKEAGDGGFAENHKSVQRKLERWLNSVMFLMAADELVVKSEGETPARETHDAEGGISERYRARMQHPARSAASASD